MIVELANNAAAYVIEGKHLEAQPRWAVHGGDLMLGPYHSKSEWYNHVWKDTIGSTGWDSSEIRFGLDDSMLQSVGFHLPPNNLTSAPLPLLHSAKHAVPGTLRLLNPTPFTAAALHARWIQPDGSALACVTERALTAEHGLWLRIAQDFDLLFVDNMLSGCLLSNPTRYLVSSWEDPHPSELDSDLAAMLVEYVTLTAEPYIERMEDEDPDVLRTLSGLYLWLGSTTSNVEQRRILRESVEDIVERFYGQELSG